jgi:hypothetical protein
VLTKGKPFFVDATLELQTSTARQVAAAIEVSYPDLEREKGVKTWLVGYRG